MANAFEIIEKVGDALYAKLNVPTVTGLATGGVWRDEVPEIENIPYLFFQYGVARGIIRAFNNTIIAEDDEWLIRAVTDENSNEDYSAGRLGALIASAADAALGNDLTISGGEVWLVERVANIPPYSEPLIAGRKVWNTAFRLRVVAK